MTRASGSSFLARGGLLALAIALLYAWVAPHDVGYGDNAEFAALGELGGVAHPSGYPAYILWLRLWSWLPVDSAAHGAALATSILGVAAVVVLHAACRAWGASAPAATLAAGLFAVSPIVLRIHTQAEVFALNSLVVSAVLWLAAPAGPLAGARRVVALAAVAGLGIANHLTCVLVAPLGIYGVVRGLRESRAWPRAAALGVAACAAGLAPYAYLLVAPPSPASWGPVADGSALVHHFLREDYGGPWGLSGHHADVSAIEQGRLLAASLLRGGLWVPTVLALVMLGVAIRTTKPRGAWLALAGSFVLAGPLLVARFNVSTDGLSRYVVERFHILPLLLLVVPMAVALDRLVAARMPLRYAKYRAAAIAATVAAAGALSLPHVARAHSPEVERGLENMLASLPERALVIGSTDVFHFGTIYMQHVRGLRTDVATITTPQLGRAPYRERVRASLGLAIEKPAGDQKLAAIVAEQALATGRPVFIDPFQAGIAARYATYPHGVLFRVLPRGQAPPPIEDVFELNKALFARFAIDYAVPDGPTQFHVHYVRAWRMIADGLRAAGRPQDQAVAEGIAAALADGS